MRTYYTEDGREEVAEEVGRTHKIITGPVHGTTTRSHLGDYDTTNEYGLTRNSKNKRKRRMIVGGKR